MSPQTQSCTHSKQDGHIATLPSGHLPAAVCMLLGPRCFAEYEMRITLVAPFDTRILRLHKR